MNAKNQPSREREKAAGNPSGGVAAAGGTKKEERSLRDWGKRGTALAGKVLSLRHEPNNKENNYGKSD